jgi:predicted  nucleic acid-binding Zn-ribbon protein
VQSFVEVVYFFHPVLWWLSGRIRAEREHCCDDLAMAVCDDRLSLAHALVRVAEFRAQPALVVAFAANKRQLLSRVRRVLGVAEPTTQRFAGYLPMAVVLLSLSVGASVYAFQGKKPEEKLQQNKVKTEKSRQAESNADTLIEHIIEVQVDEQFDEQKNVELDTQQGGTGTSTEWGPVKKITGWNGELFYVSEGETVKMLDRKSFNNDSLEKKMAEYHAKMEALQKEMQPYQEEIQSLQKRMEPLHQRIADLNLQMQKENFAVERFQREAEKLDWKKDQLMEARQQLTEKRSTVMYPKSGQAKANAAETEKQLADFETQIKAKEQEIDALNDQIKQSRVQAKEAEKPMDNLNSEMEKINRETDVYSRKMDEIGRKMDAVGRKMDAVGKAMAQESINQVIHQSTSTLRSTTITYPRPPKAPTTKSIRGSGRISPAAAPAVPKAPAAPPKKN